MFPTNQTEADAAFGATSPAAQNPQFSFMRRCEEAMQIALQTSCQVVGVEVGGWDTHNDQNARRGKLDPWLAQAMRAIYDATYAAPYNFTILVMTEFGRTNLDNSSTPSGTDHGIGGLMMLLGKLINGGVYNCSAAAGPNGAAWPDLSTGTFAVSNAQNVATDFRAVLWELMQDRFSLSTAEMQNIIPGFTPTATGPGALLNCVQ